MQEKANYKGYLIFFILILVYAVFTIRYSPIFEHLGTDKEVFQYIGMLIKNHQHPYSDVFDHKPPIIYLVNYLGVILTPNSTWGVFFILNSIGFFSALLIYKLAYNKFKNFFLPIFIYVSFVLINNSNGILEGGNLTRQLAAFLTTFILFVVFNGEKTNIKSAIIGFIIGIIFFTQQNEILGGLVLSGYYLLIEKNYKLYTLKSIVKNSMFFTLGLIIPFVGVLLIINYWDNYNDFMYQVFLFNFDNYIEDKSYITKITAVVYKFLKIVYVNKVLLVILFIILFNLFFIGKINIKKNKWNIDSKWVVIVLAFIFQIISTSISGKTYGHYFLMFIPYVICIFIFSFNTKKITNTNYLLMVLAAVLLFHSVKILPYQKPDNSLLEVLSKEVVNVKNMKGQFYSLNDTYLRINFNFNIVSPTKHIYTNFMNDEVANEVIKDLQLNKTKYVLFDTEQVHKIPQSLQLFISLNFEEIINYKEHTLYKVR